MREPETGLVHLRGLSAAFSREASEEFVPLGKAARLGLGVPSGLQ